MSWGEVFGNVFRAVLGGISESNRQEASREATEAQIRAAGEESRLGSQFDAEQEYYYNQLLRNEKARALDSNYGQFSTVQQFAPGFTRGTGLDALPEKPRAGGYDGT